MALLGVAGAHQRDHPVGMLRVRGPDLLARDLPSAVHLARTWVAHAGEVGARAGLAHADAEAELAARDAGQQRLPLLLGAEAQQQRPALPVGDPVRADGGARDQQLLDHDIAFGSGALVAAIPLRPCHADPALRAELFAELAAAARPRARALDRRLAGERLLQESADRAAKRPGFRRQVVRRGNRKPAKPSPRPPLWRPVQAGANGAFSSDAHGTQPPPRRPGLGREPGDAAERHRQMRARFRAANAPAKSSCWHGCSPLLSSLSPIAPDRQRIIEDRLSGELNGDNCGAGHKVTGGPML